MYVALAPPNFSQKLHGDYTPMRNSAVWTCPGQEMGE